MIAPKLLGGEPARTPLGDLGYTSMDAVATWTGEPPQALGGDWLWQLQQPCR